MNKWIAIPLAEVNGIRFGIKREDVRKILHGSVREFKKTKSSKTSVDDFGVCHVFYTTDDECEAVEIFNGVAVVIDGQDVFPVDIEELKRIYPDLQEDQGSFISKSNSIGVYAPDGKAESILFGAKGYYG